MSRLLACIQFDFLCLVNLLFVFLFLDFKVDQSLQYMANTFSIELDGKLYYLCAEGDKVFLQVS